MNNSNKPYMKPPYMTKLKGKDYMIVAGRVMWFRDDMPNGSIITNAILAGNQVVGIKAEIVDSDNVVLASGLATVRAGQGTSWQGRELEKAETAAIGRALAHAGYGTQFALSDMDEGDYLADSPVTRPAGNTSAKMAIWNALRNDSDIKSAYADEAVLRDRVGFYPEDVVASGFNAVKSWLLANADAHIVTE